jgi:hypothetical protein
MEMRNRRVVGVGSWKVEMIHRKKAGEERMCAVCLPSPLIDEKSIYEFFLFFTLNSYPMHVRTFEVSDPDQNGTTLPFVYLNVTSSYSL